MDVEISTAEEKFGKTDTIFIEQEDDIVDRFDRSIKLNLKQVDIEINKLKKKLSELGDDVSVRIRILRLNKESSMEDQIKKVKFDFEESEEKIALESDIKFLINYQNELDEIATKKKVAHKLFTNKVFVTLLSGGVVLLFAIPMVVSTTNLIRRRFRRYNEKQGLIF